MPETPELKQLKDELKVLTKRSNHQQVQLDRTSRANEQLQREVKELRQRCTYLENAVNRVIGELNRR